LLNIVGLIGLMAISVSLLWLARYAWRQKSPYLKWGWGGLAVLFATSTSLVSLLIVVGLIKQHTRTAPVPDLKVLSTPDQVGRGQAIADSFCDDCHSETGKLTGGVDIGKHIPIPIGSIVSANLTPTGRLRLWSDGEIFRAIRNGVGADGRWLVIMSYTNAGKLSDDDIKALIAYIRTRPAGGQEIANPPDQLNMLGLMMLGAGLLPGGKPIFTGVVSAPPKGATIEYGKYILSYHDCRECHGADLTGGVAGQLAPLGPDLTVVKEWTQEEFFAAMRTGIDPGGREIGKEMPWRLIGKMDDEELGAMYEYLAHMPDSQRGGTGKDPTNLRR
jgi:cytochrome c553